MSLFLQINLSIIPAVQTVHILALSAAGGALLMIAMRVMWDRSNARPLVDVARQFFPWIFSAIVILFLTGATLVIAEPMRSLTNVMFWSKMALVVIILAVLLVLQSQTRSEQAATGGAIRLGSSMGVVASLAVVLFVVIIFAGRWIAYTPSWGSF